MKFSFRGHSCRFTPFTSSHFPSRGLNRAGHDNSFTADPLSHGTIRILMYSQSCKNDNCPYAISRLAEFTGLDVVSCINEMICLSVMPVAGRNAWEGNPVHAKSR